LTLVEMLLREGCQGSEFADAGIGDQDIDLSLRLHGLVESIEVRQFGDVPANTCNVAADRLHGLVELLLAAARYEDVGAFIDEPLRRGEAYSRCAAGNHGHLSLQLAHYRLSSFADGSCRHSACGPDGRLLSSAFETFGACAVPASAQNEVATDIPRSF
jgi:hypothetical protein